ncbi:MAG: hypothetical protein RIG62_05360 [Cyclobacteriaceae bacterium]
MIRNLENTLKEKKIRPTAMRLLVLEYLLGQDVAVSLTDLYQSFENSDRVTLYRTLKVFEENRLVHRTTEPWLLSMLYAMIVATRNVIKMRTFIFIVMNAAKPSVYQSSAFPVLSFLTTSQDGKST